nr:hypothetical protein B0A51_15256 [Rachicladosporium sp. CCFEE 5018]
MPSPIYRPLDPSRKEIRYLHLRPGVGSQDLAASLVHADLSDPDAAAYETISYAWGHASRRTTLDIDGHILSVPETAAAALRCMRLSDQDRVLWIDSICINQADVEERGSQVAMMADIYSEGACTLAHVDMPDCDFDLVVSSIAAVRSKCEHELSSLRDLGPRLAKEEFGRSQTLTLGLGDTAITALQQFLDAAWFRRLWVLQEVTLSKRCVLHCGSGTIELDHVFEFVEIIARDPMRLIADSSFSLIAGPNIAVIVGSSKMARQVYERVYSLQGLISSCLLYGVTDDRDHVYALLGVYQKSNKRSTLPPDLIPDYTQDASIVFLRACQFAMTESQNLDLWGMSWLFRPGAEDWPSWAWRIRNFGDDPVETLSANRMKSSGVVGDCGACGSSAVFRYTQPVFQGERGQILSVRGLPIALPIEVTRVLDGLEPAVLSAFLTQVMDLFRPLQQSVGASLQKLSTILAAAWNFTAREPGDSDAEDLLDLLRSVETGSDMPWQLTPYLTSLRLACMHRRFFTTEYGIMGLGPSQLEAGDVIVILAGCKWPVALRRCPREQYRLLGVCYIGGTYMDGIVANNLVEKGIPLMQFNII